MRLREDVRFSAAVVRLLIVDSKRFWMAPSVLRRPLTAVRAASTRVIAVFAFATEVTFAVFNALLPRASEPAAKPEFAGVLPPITMVSAATRRTEPTAVTAVVAPAAVLKANAALMLLLVP